MTHLMLSRWELLVFTQGSLSGNTISRLMRGLERQQHEIHFLGKNKIDESFTSCNTFSLTLKNRFLHKLLEKDCLKHFQESSGRAKWIG